MSVRDDEGLMLEERDVYFKEEENILEEWLVEDINIDYDMKATN